VIDVAEKRKGSEFPAGDFGRGLINNQKRLFDRILLAQAASVRICFLSSLTAQILKSGAFIATQAETGYRKQNFNCQL